MNMELAVRIDTQGGLTWVPANVTHIGYEEARNAFSRYEDVQYVTFTRNNNVDVIYRRAE